MNSLFSIGEKSSNILISGNEAIVRGLLESGIGFGSTYPGTPVSEVGDLLFEFSQTESETGFIFDYALNEKVALEEAIGATWTGLRSVVIFKHLGMNVAADALHSIMYSGINEGGGIVLIVGGDPQASSSTNAEDVRLYSKHTHLPILFPSTVEEMYQFSKKAFNLSEEIGLPVMLYTTPKLSFMTGSIHCGVIPKSPQTKRSPPTFKKNFERLINARHFALHNRDLMKRNLNKITKYQDLENFFDIPDGLKDGKIAIITGGYPYLLIKDALEELALHNEVPILKLNIIYPISSKSILDFVKSTSPEHILIIEEGEPMIENDVKRILYDSQQNIPISNVWALMKGYPKGKSPGELTHHIIESQLRKTCKIKYPKGLREYLKIIEEIKQNVPPREPTFCPGCSHRNVFYALRKVADEMQKTQNKELVFGGDIGCYTLGMSPPWSVMDWLICMGAGVGIANGVGRALEKFDNTTQHVVALIGDSTLLHSGIDPILNILKDNLDVTILILNNYHVAMTGGQPVPLDPYEIIKNLGESKVSVVGGYNIPLLEKTFKNVFSSNEKGTKIVMINAECALAVKHRAKVKWNAPRGKERGEELYISINESCPMCHECFREFGCTAIRHTEKDGRLVYFIDESSCMREYCQACLDVCPNHCIEKIIINPKRDGN